MTVRECARQDGTFIAVSESPDPCKTPPSNRAVPYQITASLEQCLSVSPNVRYNGKPVVLAGESSIAQVTGDESGTGGGVKSGTHKGDVRFLQGAATVKANGKPIVRVQDPVAMNNGNTQGRIQGVAKAAPALEIRPQGQPTQSCNAPLPRPRGTMGPTASAGNGLICYGRGRVDTVSADESRPKIPTIPIVFVPGCMGSNLRVRPECAAEVRRRFEEAGRGDDFTTKAWELPNVYHSLPKLAGTFAMETVWFLDSPAGKTAKRWEGFGPKFRQLLLNPETTEVDEQGFIPGDLRPIDGKPGKQMAEARGWGSVHWDSYGDFLCQLQAQLNPLPHRFTLAPEARKAFITAFPHIHGRSLFGDDAPTDSAIEHASRFHYPVFAAGYNWTQSNLDSAKYLLTRIDLWLRQLQEMDCECSQVILVTHSMGGFVARVASKLDQDGKQQILGVVHGAMPAIGAPALFQQVVAGTDDGSPKVLEDLRKIEPRLLGRTPAETTAVVANSPGCLELLPSFLYPKGWLRAERERANGGETTQEWALPIGNDPYTDIYRVKAEGLNRLVDPALLDPAKISFKETNKVTTSPRETAMPWDHYISRINAVEKFHHTYLNNVDYHPNTYAFYGAKKATFNKIQWHRVPGRQVYETPFEPNRRDWYVINDEIYWVGDGHWMPPNGDGDSTVAVESGSAPQMHVTKIYWVEGFKHQDAFNIPQTRAYTILSICKLVKNCKA
jgi:hypothetical protein